MTSKEALEKWFNTISTQDKIRWEENYKLINKDLEILEIIKKYLEVLDIIKNKDVRIRVLLASKNVEEYNYSILFEIQHLTQEEFYLLKEWLENE